MEEAHVASVTGYPLYKPELPPTMRWVRCVACGHVFVDGYFTDEALRILFAESHAGQSPGQDVEATRYVSARMIEAVSAFRGEPGGRWLDVGFGNGALLTTAAELGWDVAGLDLREESVRLLREAGFEAHAVPLAKYRSTKPFDVISMADVLEHMPFPKEALVHARALLRDGGVLFLSMPNSDSFLWDTLTKNGVNPYWAELEHLHNFGRKRLCRLLEECGFAPRRFGVSVRYRACIEILAQKVGERDCAPRPAVRPSGEMRLNLGCGRSPIPGWVNVDSAALPGVDIVADLETVPLPFEDDTVTEINASHVLEHIRSPLPLMQELHRIAKPGALATFRVPYGSSDDADEDPTHVRRYFWGSWGYFSQPHYWRADYGYRGDWDLEDVVLVVSSDLKGKSWEEAFRAVQERRNVVTEMVAKLRAVKPLREPLRELQKKTLVRFVTTE
jgi:2-polyprenyl-3-methyl-5-hydroxy-6-metoxy-1,4-benzoquinol methylase